MMNGKYVATPICMSVLCWLHEGAHSSRYSFFIPFSFLLSFLLTFLLSFLPWHQVMMFFPGADTDIHECAVLPVCGDLCQQTGLEGQQPHEQRQPHCRQAQCHYCHPCGLRRDFAWNCNLQHPCLHHSGHLEKHAVAMPPGVFSSLAWEPSKLVFKGYATQNDWV